VDRPMPLPELLRSLQPAAPDVDEIDIGGDETRKRDRIMGVPRLRPGGDNRGYFGVAITHL
jgi:hypothetical protein